MPQPTRSAPAAAAAGAPPPWPAAARRRAWEPWQEFPKAPNIEPRPCPKCAAPMRAGSLPGQGFELYRCAPCDGFLFSRVDWVTFTPNLG